MPSLPTPAANLFASSLHSFFFRRRRQSYELNPPEQSHQVIYLGNVLTAGLGKGESSVDKPLNVIWRTWNAKRGQRQQIGMRLSATRSGLKAETKQLGLTEYWAHRITFCIAPPQYPRVFCWVYKHEGKRMKPELRCHAVLCKKANEPAQLQQMLSEYLHAALQEYKREKLAAERARKHSLLSTCPRRKILLQTGALNFRPPVSRSRSAPRLGSIDEEDEEFLETLTPAPTKPHPPSSPLPIISVNHHPSVEEEEEELEDENVEDEEMEEEEDGEFSDLDANSLNLEAHYRTTPVLSGDSSSQQSSAPSSASSSSGCAGGDKCCGGDHEEDVDEDVDLGEDNAIIINENEAATTSSSAPADGRHNNHHLHSNSNAFEDEAEEDDVESSASTSSKASTASNASKSSTTSGHSSLQSNCCSNSSASSSSISIDTATNNVTTKMAAFRLCSPSTESSFNRASQFRINQQRGKKNTTQNRVVLPIKTTMAMGEEEVDDGIEEIEEDGHSQRQTIMLYGPKMVGGMGGQQQRKAGTIMVTATFGRQEIRL